MARQRKQGSFRSALAHRDFRYLLSALAVSKVGDWLYGVAFVVFVFEQTGSPAWVAAASIVRLSPYVLFGTLGGVLADRYDRRSVMLVADFARALLMFALAALTAASGSVVLAMAVVFAATTLGTPFDPAQTALVPAVVGEEDLAATNAVSSAVEHLAILIGPAIGGALLLVGPAPLAFAINGATFLLSALCVAAVRTRTAVDSQDRADPLLRRLTAGFRAIAAQREVGLLVAFIVTVTFVYGVELVVWVLVSERLLGTGSEGVGFILAALGAGGLLAAGLSGRLVATKQPAILMLVLAFALGLPLASLSVIRLPALAYAVLVVEGAANIVFEVFAITTLQRLVRREVMARVFGAIDSFAVGGIVLGSMLAPLLINLLGLRVTLIIGGMTLPLLTLLSLPVLRGIGQRAVDRMDELAPRVELIDGLRIFEGADRAALEAVAGTVEERTVPPGCAVIREGDAAQDFFVVVEGELDVLSSGEAGGPQVSVNTLRAGDYFGEIGLLQQSPRTASVVTTTDCVLYRISGDDFLTAVTAARVMPGALLESMSGRLARTHPSRMPTMPSTSE